MTGDGMAEEGMLHRTDALAEYAAGALGEAERTEVEAHLAGCPSCRAEVAGWAAVAAAARTPGDPPPSAASVVRAALRRAAVVPRTVAPAPRTAPVSRRRLGFATQLLRAELRLVRPSVWLASMLVMACAVALAVGGGEGAGATVLSLISPLVAAAGVAGVYGPQRDPAYEVFAVTVTPPRLVLLARVTLVFSYDLALAVAASAVVDLAAARLGLVDLVVAWLGPMALLSALSLVLAMWVGPTVAMAAAASLWVLRVLTTSVPGLAGGWLAAGMREIWTTNRGSVAATIVLLAAAVLLSRRGGAPRRGRYRPAV